MVALMQKQEVEYKSAQDLRKNNATEGSWKGQFRDKFEERSEQVDEIQAGLNAEAAQGNIQASQQAQATQYIINPITGEVLETSGSYEDELSVASIISMVERGASDTEIEAALDEALTSITGKMASDKKNAKKYMAQLLEVLHVLELSMKQAGKNVDLQNSLKQMQERMSKLMKTGDVKQMQEFLRSSQLRDVLVSSVQQSRQGVDALRAIQEMTRNMARQAKEANLPRELALHNLQQVSRNILQSQLREGVDQLRDAYTKLTQEFKKETNPANQDALKNALREITAQARALQELAKQTQKPELSTKQFEAVQRSLQQLQANTAQLAANKQLGQVGQEVAQRLAAQQAVSLRSLDSRLAAQRVTQGNLNIASQAGKQNVLANLKATENILVRNGNTQQKPELVKTEPQVKQNPIEKGVETKPDVKLEPEVKLGYKTPQNPEVNTNSKNFQQEQPKQTAPEQKAGKFEPADPCKDCGGDKGCCSSMGKAEPEVVAPPPKQPITPPKFTAEKTGDLQQRHNEVKAQFGTLPKTKEVAETEQVFGKPPAPEIKATKITAPPPPSQEASK